MQIKKSELRKVIHERLQMFFSDSKPFATVGRAPTFEAGIEDPNGKEIEVDQEALDAAIRIAKRDAKDIQKEPKIFDGLQNFANDTPGRTTGCNACNE